MNLSSGCIFDSITQERGDANILLTAIMVTWSFTHICSGLGFCLYYLGLRKELEYSLLFEALPGQNFTTDDYCQQHDDLHLAPPPHNWDHLGLSGIFILLLLLIIWAWANRSDFTADIRRDHTRPLLLAPRLRNARFHPRPGLDHDLKIKIW